MNTVILIDSEAKKELRNILKSYDRSTNKYGGMKVCGLFAKSDGYISFDNTTGDCKVEEFTFASEARNWIDGGAR